MPYMILEIEPGRESEMSTLFARYVIVEDEDGVWVEGKVIEIGNELHPQEEE